VGVKRIFLAAQACLLTLLFFFPARAQQGQEPGPARPAPQKSSEGGIRVKVQVVNAPVSVRDSKNNVVLDLHKEDFQILENRVKQKIESFDLASEPRSTVLVIETSSRVAPLLPELRKSASVFTQTVVGESGNAAVVGYDKVIQRIQPFTSNSEDIEKSIAGLKAGDPEARLYDAIADGVVQLRTVPQGRRRILIVLGESDDVGSNERFGEVLRQAQFANVVIYSVGLSTASALARSEPWVAGGDPSRPPGTLGKPPFPGTAPTPDSDQQYSGNLDLGALAEIAVRNAGAKVFSHPLEVAAAGTGGTFQSAIRDRTIENALAAIGGDLNALYTLTYEPTESNKPGYHEIRILINRKGLKVRTRPGYYLEAQ
jgi:VWFA-related protein